MALFFGLWIKDDDGTIWVAVKPICDGIGLDYSRALKQIKMQEVLGGAWSLKTMHDSSALW